MTVNTIFPLASMTKLLTCIAAVQLIDRGLITPDTDVTPYLPVLASLPILKSFDPSTGEETTTPRKNPILLRHLLTHSSGLGYPFLDPLLRSRAEFLSKNNKAPPAGPGVPERYGSHPLLFEPGSSWTYGSGIDWAGHLVEILTGQDLETHLQTNIVKPLNLPHPDTQNIITFYPERQPQSVQDRQMQLTVKLGPESNTNNRVTPLEGPPPLFNADPSRDVYGGEAGHADLSAYIEILHSLLDDNDERLLRNETKELLFTPMLKEPAAKAGLLQVLKDPSWIVGHLPDTGEYDHSLGGVIVDTDGHDRRRKGFLLWGGMYNLSWVRIRSIFSLSLSFLASFLFHSFFSVFLLPLFALIGRKKKDRRREKFSIIC